ncbi:MAG TPA: TIGR00730 family Rossman fold protein [Candidatus Binatia bacterium]|nr:TIGR00730 family Rossman fold protein [Candidatus Binatia bacterium]
MTSMDDVQGRICVFTGSRHGSSPGYTEAAKELGRELVRHGYGLVYGGGNVGLMNVIANTVLGLQGHVTGVIPSSLVSKEVAHRGISDLRVVNSMHERKALMAELSDGFIAMPGGIGTMEEFFEVLSWAQLGLHEKPCGLLNVSGYYDHLIQFLDYAVAQDFIKSKDRALMIVEEQPGRLLNRFEQVWISRPPKQFNSTVT